MNSNKKIYKELIISGGGTNGLGILGSLHYLYTNKYLENINTYIGTSVGALISFLIVIGYEPETIYKIMSNISYETLSELNPDKILLFFDTLGVMSGEKMIKLLSLFLKKKNIEADITFHKLYLETQKELIITGYNLTKKKTNGFSHKNNPNMRVIDACRISFSVPFIFRPVLYDNELYIDGGFIENIPTRFSKNKDDALILFIHRKNKNMQHIPQDVFEFAQVLFNQMYFNLDKSVVKKCKKYKNLIEIEVNNSSSQIINFSMQKNEKEYLYNIGYITTKKFLN